MNVYSLHATGFTRDGQRVKLCCRDVFLTKAEAEGKLGWFAKVARDEGPRHGLDTSQAVVVSVLEQRLVDRGWTLSLSPPDRAPLGGKVWGSWSEGPKVHEFTVNVEDVPLKIRFADLSGFEGFKLEMEVSDAVQPAGAQAEEGPVPPQGLPGPGGAADSPPGAARQGPRGDV